MPLYEHKNGEDRARTRTDSVEDKRLAESKDWTLVPEDGPARQPGRSPRAASSSAS